MNVILPFNAGSSANGINVRGFDDAGITVCLDSKIHEDFQKHEDKYPDWFVGRVGRRCY